MKDKHFLRDVAGSYITELGRENNSIVVVNADLSGTSRNRSFTEEFPSRSFNTGIAEQNAVSFAAGLAHEGFIPYVFTMAPFLTMRACEQCRTDVAYENLSVKLVGHYSGVSGGISGATHWAIEDCAIMSGIPNMRILEPCDVNQAQRMLELMCITDGPVYLRLSCEPCLDFYDNDFKCEIGGSVKVRQGNDGAVLASGVMVQYAYIAAEKIAAETGKQFQVVDMYSIKPIDKAAIISAANTGKIVVVQDHNIIGGLGSMVAMVIAENGIRTNFKTIGIDDQFVPMAHPQFLYKKFGMDSEGLYDTLIRMIEN